MQRIQVGALPESRFSSHGVTLHHPSSGPQTLFTTTGPASMVLAEMAAGGVLGRHPAVGPQLLMVSSGSVQVAGGDGRWEPLGCGDAVMFEDGEEHETRAITAATVSILQWGSAG